MSLNQMILSGPLLTELYREVLIDSPAESHTRAFSPGKEQVHEEATGLKMLGEGRKGVVLIVNTPGKSFVSDEDLILITRMLGACGLHLGDVSIINIDSAPADMARISKELTPLKVLLFGVNPLDVGLPFHFPEFKQQEYAGIQYLSIPSLPRLSMPTEEGKLLKSKLWISLRHLFGI